MGKQGPCHHCGVTSTPLWRNGPPDKPILCNACGSRWRTKGSLANYTPLHSRADNNDNKNNQVIRVKKTPIHKNKDKGLVKRKIGYDNGLAPGFSTDSTEGYTKVLDEDTSNRSSSGSAISNPESCLQFMDASDFTDPSNPITWETMIPSRKRSCISRPKPSPFEELTKDLYTILHEQQSSCFSGSSEEELIFDNHLHMDNAEIGHGSVLIRHPSSVTREEESEASSLSFENKIYSTPKAYSSVCYGKEKTGFDKSLRPMSREPESDQSNWIQHAKSHVLKSRNSPLCNIDLHHVVNFEEFVKHCTVEEQQSLMKYVAPLDSSLLPSSLEQMFDSRQFRESILSYQKLLAEGVFDLSFAPSCPRDGKILYRELLSSASRSKWVELYHHLKKSKNVSGESYPLLEHNDVRSTNIISAKRSEFKAVKIPRRNPAGHHEDQDDSLCFSPRRLFELPPDGATLDISYGSASQDPLHVPSSAAFSDTKTPHTMAGFSQIIGSGSNFTFLDPKP